ncbi:MAG: branched-chain amino acid aminotransferase [Ferruginibacter sp.]|nr:branched-chain amino acid aminotransferase [Ferruginibacter sp.]
MTVVADFKINRVQRSKLEDISLENIPFGKYFTDHMLEVDYENGEWKTPEIKPYQPLQLDPSLAALHYGQAIFEGVKAYKDEDGNPSIFRPLDNMRRFNLSAERMQMPVVPEEIFLEGMRQLIDIDRDWIPAKENHSLYIRPFMFSSDEAIGVRPSDKYKFLIILSPTGPYYANPMRIYVEEKYVRAVEGGYGFAKAAGNYGGALLASAEAQKKGYDQVLWMDAFEHKYVQECGTMNVFFVIGNTAVTPGLDSGTILAGVTRDSAITLLKEQGLKVEERQLSIDEIISAYEAGTLKEIFGTGTAATISLIRELRYKDYTMKFDVENWTIATGVKRRMDAIKYGKETDDFGWLYKI